MVTRYIDIDEDKWGIILIYDFNVHRNEAELSAIMEAFGMPEKRIDAALDVLSYHNSGMAISNFGVKMSAVFVADATSKGQWWNSMAHEMRHVSDAILDYYGDDWDGETPAYLEGYIFQKIVEEIAEPCR